ncbi:MAG: nucleotidyltransferase family protein [Janthinobacterium lividum]
MPDVANAGSIEAWLRADPSRWRILGIIRQLELPDCWIGAGFVRNAVWDALHGRPASVDGDVDVLWFDRRRTEPGADAGIEATLRRLDPAIDWSVRNQARMHVRNGDPPYRSTEDAMRCWPETATAVAVRRTMQDGFEVNAPLGLADLFGLVLRPAPGFQGSKHRQYLERVEAKGWLSSWPRLRMEEAVAAP